MVDGELFDLVKNCAADFDDGKLGGVGGICRGGEDAKVAFDLALGTYGVEEASDGVLVSLSVYESRILCVAGRYTPYRSGLRWTRT